MRTIQEIDFYIDNVIAVDGYHVLNPIAVNDLPYTISDGDSELVDINLYNITDESVVSQVSNVNMTYHLDSECWTMQIDDVLSASDVGKKFIGKVTSVDSNFRDFHLDEFRLTDGLLEKVIATVGYEYNFSGTPEIIWTSGSIQFSAPVYEGGSGTTPAQSVSKITHRGPITRV